MPTIDKKVFIKQLGIIIEGELLRKLPDEGTPEEMLALASHCVGYKIEHLRSAYNQITKQEGTDEKLHSNDDLADLV